MHSTNSMQFLAIAAIMSLTACTARYPMGLSREQWDALPPSQQAEYQAKQYQIDTDNRVRAEETRRQAEAKKAEQSRMETERLRQAYSTAQYGDIVTVTVQGGILSYSGKRYPYEPVSFDLIKGETKKVLFRGRGIQTIATEYAVRLSEDGNTIYFDDDSRQRTVLVNQNWENGEQYRPSATQNDVNVGISGMTFFVKLKTLPGSPQRLIIQNR